MISLFSLSPVVQISLIANETVFEEINSVEIFTIDITATATVSTGGIIATDFTVDLSISSSTASKFCSVLIK